MGLLNMLTSQILAYISEREIDLLLLEELHVSDVFRAWFVSQIFGARVQCAQFVAAWHSISQSGLGESDVVFQFQDSSGKVTVILVEDKIDAPPQPNQAERYRLRGLAGVENGSWEVFSTCMVAPEAYLSQMAEEAAKYDVRISYESIRDWFLQSSPNDARKAYKARVIQEGIEQNRRGYQPVIHPVVTRFWAEYWQVACDEFPELQMENPGQKPARSDWAQFRSRSNSWIRHKLGKGTVELEIQSAGDELEQIATWNAHLLVDGVDVVPVGKSASFTILTPTVNKLADLSPQIEAVRTGLAAVERLMILSSQVALAGPRP